jgi:hypothetical protein
MHKSPVWNVYGSVQQEGFDPLAVSKQFGDYPVGGTRTGARWMKADVEYPEKVSDRSTWQQTKVGFTNGK